MRSIRCDGICFSGLMISDILVASLQLICMLYTHSSFQLRIHAICFNPFVYWNGLPCLRGARKQERDCA